MGPFCIISTLISGTFFCSLPLCLTIFFHSFIIFYFFSPSFTQYMTIFVIFLLSDIFYFYISEWLEYFLNPSIFFKRFLFCFVFLIWFSPFGLLALAFSPSLSDSIALGYVHKK